VVVEASNSGNGQKAFPWSSNAGMQPLGDCQAESSPASPRLCPPMVPLLLEVAIPETRRQVTKRRSAGRRRKACALLAYTRLAALATSLSK